MTEISFKLVRKQNPDLNFDSLDDINKITLASCGIEAIDNLELFNHLQELDLSHNKIEIIEHLIFFDKLKLLDISYNRIDSNGLIKSLKGLPKSLGFINLTGNPCSLDEVALTALQDAFPDMNIVIDEMNEEEYAKAQAEEKDIEEEEEENNENIVPDRAPWDPAKPLNADEVLKEIVERKSKLQSYMPFNLDATVTELNDEFSKSIAANEVQVNTRKERLKGSYITATAQADSLSGSITARREKLQQDADAAKERDATKFHELIGRLRATKAKAMEDMRAPIPDQKDM